MISEAGGMNSEASGGMNGGHGSFNPRESRDATDEDNSLLERIVVNAMRVISGEHKAKIDSILYSGKTPGEGLSNAITFVLQSVIGGLQEKGVEIDPGLILSENGAASQITQLLVAILGAAGKNITPNEVQQALSVGMENFSIAQKMQGKQQEPQAQPQAQPQTQPQQQPGRQQGLLASSARV